MPTKIRLQRKGKKGQPFYHIIIADGRAPREGRFIEKIGVYNPLTKPAEIEIEFDKAVDWLQKGAQPTDTVRAILSYKGVMYKSHLLKGVKKGAFSLEQANEKFEVWNTEKLAKISRAKTEHILGIKDEKKKQLAEEVKVNEAKANAIAKKYAKALEAQAEAAAEAAAVAEAPIAEPVTEEPQAE
jgi:small subunit ribosomal protein S16